MRLRNYAKTELFTTIYIFGVMLLYMPFPRPRRTDSEDVLYEYAVGALGRRMRSVAELVLSGDPPTTEATGE